MAPAFVSTNMYASHSTRITPATRGYARRQPEDTVLHSVVQDHLATLLDTARDRSEHGFGNPQFVEREFEKFLACGLLCHGFVRVRCDTCAEERLVAFSCKTRGFVLPARVAGWQVPRQISSTTYSRSCPTGSGYCRCRVGCGFCSPETAAPLRTFACQPTPLLGRLPKHLFLSLMRIGANSKYHARLAVLCGRVDAIEAAL